MSTTYSDSRKRTLKRDSITGSANMAAPVTSAYSGTLFVTNITVPHPMGAAAMYRYSYEPFKDGKIWPNISSRLGGSAQNPVTLVQGPGIIAWVDATNLYLQLYYFDATLTGTYPVYYQIYRDYIL